MEHILEFTAPEVWADLKGKRIFVTGGTGFFGSWLLESFIHANSKLSLGAELHVLSRDPNAFRAKAPHLADDSAVHFHRGDVCDFEFPSGTFSHIIHAATTASAQLNIDRPSFMLETILQGSRRTLEFARQCGAKKFLFTSSGAVYGRQPPELSHIPESYVGAPDPLSPVSAYGEGKRCAELLSVLEGQSKFNVVIARCFAFFGPYLPLNSNFAVGNFIRDGLNGGTIQVGGDGTPYRSYLYGADLAIWLWTLLVSGRNGQAYNVGSDLSLSIGDLAHKVAQFSQSQVKVAKIPPSGQKAERYVPSVERAHRELGLKPRIGLEEGLKRMRLAALV